MWQTIPPPLVVWIKLLTKIRKLGQLTAKKLRIKSESDVYKILGDN